MWISKIKKYLQELDRIPILNTVFIISITCIASIYIFAMLYGFNKIIGYEHIGNIVGIFSSIATTLTLVFVVYQHKANESKAYQMVMVEEAKLAVDKMIEGVKKLYEWDGKDVPTLNNTLIELSNHAIDFETFYDELNESALKKIVEIRWQDMFLNHYQGMSNDVDVCEIFRRNTEVIDTAFEVKLVFLNEEFDSDEQGGKYEAERYYISRAKEFDLYDISNYISCQDQFKRHFMNGRQVRKYLEGVSYKNNQRKIYPTLCAIVDSSIE
jgi:hypothetical protein